MCQTDEKSKTLRWNGRVSRLLFITVFTALVVQRAESMPSRSQRQYHRVPEVDLTKEEYDELGGSTFYVQESPAFIRNFSIEETERRESGRNEGRGGYFGPGKIPSDTDAIKFPEELKDRGNFLPQPIPTCRGKTFCEETASLYPQEYMSNLISRTESLKFFSGVDQIDVGERFDSSDGGETLCGSETKIVFPKTAQTGSKEWLFVLQDEKQGYKQGVKVENCNVGTAEGACQIIEGSILGYKTSCKQKYVSRVLAAVHKNGTAVTENFSMPSSCCCQIKLVGDGVGLRLGGANPKNQSPAIKPRRNR